MVSSVTRSYGNLQVEPPYTIAGEIPLATGADFDDLMTFSPNYIHRVKFSIIGQGGTAGRAAGFSVFRFDLRVSQSAPAGILNLFDYYDTEWLPYPINMEFNFWAGEGRVSTLQSRLLAAPKTGFTFTNLDYLMTVTPYYRYEIVPPPQPERTEKGTLQRQPGTSFLGTTKKILPVVRRPSAVWGALPLGT